MARMKLIERKHVRVPPRRNAVPTESHNFSSMDDLEKVDVGGGVIPRPTYVSVHLNTSQKQELIELLKAYV
jgi:hypothetical protein